MLLLLFVSSSIVVKVPLIKLTHFVKAAHRYQKSSGKGSFWAKSSFIRATKQMKEYKFIRDNGPYVLNLL